MNTILSHLAEQIRTEHEAACDAFGGEQHLMAAIEDILPASTPLDEMIEFVTTNDRLMPWPCKWVSDKLLVVAKLNYDEWPELEVYKKAELLAWHKRTKALLKQEQTKPSYDEYNYSLHDALQDSR